MLKIDIDKRKERSVVEASGSTMELVLELTSLIGHLYQALHSNNAENGKAFQSMIRMAISNDAFWKTASCGDDDVGFCRHPGESVKPEQIEKLLRVGATPEQIARYCGGVE